MPAKIVELQGLRCVAIISVLLYHVWPDFFVNGFLGVDIFFVISGYFMALILLSPKNEKSFTNFILSFYYRRIYRILPLYLINIAATLIIVPAISYTLNYADFFAQIKSALIFTTNFSMFFQDQNYFNKTLSFQWFKHYWSLCVEMQFYTIIPFLAYFCRKMPTYANLFLIWPLLIAASQCLSLFMLINFEQKGSIFTFGMLSTRIWQFGGGFCAFYALKFIDKYDKCKALLFLLKVLRHSITTNILSILLLTITRYGIVQIPLPSKYPSNQPFELWSHFPLFNNKNPQFFLTPCTLFPLILNQAYAQIGTIILTSILIAGIGRSKEKEELQYSILANRFVVFIGDASYALYISHWILVTFFDIFYEHKEANRKLLLFLCLGIGALVHLWIEKPICKAKFKPKNFFSMLFLTYFAIGFGILTTNIPPAPIPSSIIKDIFHNKSKLISNESQWAQVSSTLNSAATWANFNRETSEFLTWSPLCFFWS